MKKRKKYSIIALIALFMAVSFTSCSSDESDKTNDEPESQNDSEGAYLGLWNSTTPSTSYTNFAVSAIMNYNSDQTTLSGVFFATSNYLPCCGNTDNNGTIRITLDGNTITSYTYTETIPNCMGSFSGTGTRDSNGVLTIDFTGNDCDGDHVGQIVFTPE